MEFSVGKHDCHGRLASPTCNAWYLRRRANLRSCPRHCGGFRRRRGRLGQDDRRKCRRIHDRRRRYERRRFLVAGLTQRDTARRARFLVRDIAAPKKWSSPIRRLPALPSTSVECVRVPISVMMIVEGVRGHFDAPFPKPRRIVHEVVC